MVLNFFTYLILLANKITRFTSNKLSVVVYIENTKLTNCYSLELFIIIYTGCNLWLSQFTPMEYEIYPRLRTTVLDWDRDSITGCRNSKVVLWTSICIAMWATWKREAKCRRFPFGKISADTHGYFQQAMTYGRGEQLAARRSIQEKSPNLKFPRAYHNKC